MNILTRALTLLLISASTPSYAQEVPAERLHMQAFTHDLNGDGHLDVVTVAYSALGSRVFIFEDHTPNRPNGAFVAALYLGINQTSWPDVEINEAGGLSLYAGCDTCGSRGNVHEYKIIHRNDAYIVSGYTLTTNNRLNASVWVCDYNLLTGDLEISDYTYKETIRQITAERIDMRLDELDENFMPTACAR